MARLVVTYKTPKDARAFDDYYARIHVPLAKKIPGLRRYEISRGAVESPAGASGIHLVAILQFDDLATLKAGLSAKEGQAAAADLGNFATGGVDLVFFDTKEV